MSSQPSIIGVSPDINSPIELQRSSWKSKYEAICATHVRNGEKEFDNNKSGEEEEEEEEEGKVEMQKPNALVGLSGYLSSSDESECEDSELGSEVKSFLKDVEAIDSLYKNQSTNKSTDSSKKSAPTIGWQECYDQSTGYTYYWNVDTNEVTWSMPEAYKKHLENMKNWQEFQAQAEVAAALQKVRQQQQKQQLEQQQALLKQQALDQLNQIKQAEALKAAKKEKAKAKKNRKATSAKQSDSEDEKIELITSYGPDSGDESSTDPETKVEDKPPPTKKKKTVKPPKEPEKDDASPVVMGPQLPPAILKRQRMHSVVLAKNRSGVTPYRQREHGDSTTGTSHMPAPPPPPSLNSTDLRKFKSSEAVSSRGGGVGSNAAVRKRLAGKEEDLKIVDRRKSPSQSLKEVKSTSMTVKTSKETAGTKGNELLPNGPSRESDAKNSAKPGSDSTAETNSSSLRKPKLELLYKKNHDVQLPDSGKDDTRGLGFSTVVKDDDRGQQSQSEQDRSKRAKSDKIMFVKAETLRLSEEDSKGNKESALESTGNVDIKDLSSLLLDKMTFLSVGKEPVPPVQIWTIQLETLLSAWEAQQLTSTHITDWLRTTSAELDRLESTGAPDGWLCQWHRSKKCYSYKNLKTSEVVWEYPQATALTSTVDSEQPTVVLTGTNRGEEDMEVCTTPPPPPSPPRISPLTPPPPSCSPSLSRSPAKKRKGFSPPKEKLPPLPPLPPPAPHEPPPLPPDDPPPPPPPLHQSEPLPPGVDPPEPVPPISIQPPAPRPEFALHMQIPAIHTPVCVIPQMHYPLAYPTVPVAPAPLPVSIPQPRAKDNKHDLSSELDIFYNDIAQLEPTAPLPPAPPPPAEATTPPPPPQPSPPASRRDPSPPTVANTINTAAAGANVPLSLQSSVKLSSALSEEATVQPIVSSADGTLKKKKKTKLAPGLALKKKGVSSLVAKWQQVQEDVRRDLKNIED